MRAVTAFGGLLILSISVAAIQIDAATFAKTKFDFIVVGGGTAGTALATRLSEIPTFTVGLIEAGLYRPDDERINTPTGFITGNIWGNPEYDWNIATIPQVELNNREIPITRGKLLGGCSGVNLYGVFLAGSIEYDQMGELGNEGWSYNTTLQYFKKATNFTAASPLAQEVTHATYDPAFHGTDGPIHVTFSDWWSEAINPPAFDTLVNLGLLPLHDGTAGVDAGQALNPPLGINPETKTRSYSAVEYYGRNENRTNLLLLTGAQATKIITSASISSSSSNSSSLYTATGVSYVVNNQTYTAHASKEIVLSAGNFGSPQLLELSGIGNKTIIESFGIESIVDLPGVGENYQDHIIAYTDYVVPNNYTTWDAIFDPVKNATFQAEYAKNGSGPFGSGVTLISFEEASFVMENDTQLAIWIDELDAQFNASNPSAGRRAMYEIERARMLPGSNQTSYEIYIAPSNAYASLAQPNTSYIQIAAYASHPFSRGSSHIGSADPLAKPVIDLNAYHFDMDLHIIREGAKWCRKVAQTEPLKSLIQEVHNPPLSVSTDAEWEEFIRNNAAAPTHSVGTNAMLPREWDGVVDNKLVVYGTSNLRVVDVSILPLELGTHPSGTAYSIAERAADMIKQAHGAL